MAGNSSFMFIPYHPFLSLSKTLDRRMVNSKSTSSLGDETSNGGPVVPPRRVSMGAFLNRSSASFSGKPRPMKAIPNSITLGKNSAIAGVSCFA